MSQAPHQLLSLLLILPREVRDIIYEEYLAIDAEDGYVFIYETGRLRTYPHRLPVDLNLMYTCRLIADEMRGLPLRLATITFTTVASDSVRVRAAQWNYLTNDIAQLHKHLLDIVVELLTSDHIQMIEDRYPWISGLFRDYQLHDVWCGVFMEYSPWAQPPSVTRDAIRFILELMTSDQPSIEWLSRNWSGGPNSTPEFIRAAVSMCPKPWDIPTEEGMYGESRKEPHPWKQCLTGCADTIKNKWTTAEWESDPCNYRFSAAAAAIQFLGAFPGARQHIRRIVLWEDLPSVAFPESHARGLIPFCKDCPLLRIEHRVSLWTNAFLRGREWRSDWKYWYERGNTPHGLPADGITIAVAQWMAEALVVSRAGMPRGAYSMLLDGGLMPEKSAEIFKRVIQRDAAFQEAMLKSTAWDLATNPMNFRRVMTTFTHIQSELPQLLRDMVNRQQDCVISGNFDFGEPWDIEGINEIIRRHQAHPEFFPWDRDDVWPREDEYYETTLPLPKWGELMRQGLFTSDKV